MKKLINNVENVISESLDGMQLAHPEIIKVQHNPDIILRAGGAVKGKVSLVSGGGSGHEPLHGGYVGKGMLHAACPGDIFTSPTPDQIEAAANASNGGAGVLFIIKNYSGDIMNFEMAADLVSDNGIKTESVIIDDDVAVENSLYTQGRRGVGTTVFAEKICGAASERAYSLAETADLCKKINSLGRSMGMALSSCTVPAAGKPTFNLPETEMEIGIGIHGEPGVKRMELKKASEIAEIMLEAVIKDIPFKSGDSTILMVNGMGGTPLIELYLMYNEALKILGKHGIKVARNLVGNYITSLDMQGCSFSLLKADDEIIKLWDDPVYTAGLRWGM